MTSAELKEIVEQRSSDTSVLGKLACNLRTEHPVEQHNSDGQRFSVRWQEFGGYWRCTVMSSEGSDYLARIDVHDNATMRLDARQPCSVTISPEDDLLCLTRYR